MNRILVVIMLVVAALVMTVLLYDPAHAKRVATIEDGTLVVTETTELARIPNVPKGLGSSVATDLVSGELLTEQIADKSGVTTTSFKFPWVMTETRYSDKIVSYQDNHWISQDLPARTTQNTKSRPATSFLVLLPLLCIMLVSVVCPLSKCNLKMLPLFYLAVFASVWTGTINPLIGFFGGFLAFGFASVFCTNAPNSIISLSAALTGAFVGVSAVTFGESLQPYAIFLLAVCVNSFILAIGVSEIMKIRGPRKTPCRGPIGRY
ncbi:MAG: hypothetical protein WCW36_00975 [Candidatus Paceibacterota bacterium]|jgi:hypothetical protein